jgi:hypothetical protein
LFDEKTPLEYRSKIEDYKKECELFVPCFLSDSEKMDAGSYLHGIILKLIEPETGYVVTTNLDTDDSLHSDFVAVLQKKIGDEPKVGVYSILWGIQYFPSKKMVIKMKYPHSHFQSLCENCDSGFKTIKNFSHTKVRKIFPYIDVYDKRGLWLEVVHDSNISNTFRVTSRIKYRGIYRSFSLCDFGIDICLSACNNIFNSVFRKSAMFLCALFKGIKRKLCGRKVKVVVNPKYQNVAKFVESLPSDFKGNGKIIYDSRNMLKEFDVEGMSLCVKRYHMPVLPNRIIYSFLRKPKALRAYEYSFLINEKGFESPESVGYVKEMSAGLMGLSYYVYRKTPYSHIMREMGNASLDECGNLAEAFAKYTAGLHDAGILHKDYSPGNILFDKVNGEYRFSLIDTNRMKFSDRVGMKEGCANFRRLWGKTPVFELMARTYARRRGFDEKQCVGLVLSYRKKFWDTYRRRHKVSFDIDI